MISPRPWPWGVAALLIPALAAGQPSASCVRVAFGQWAPPLDWSGSGHGDSSQRIGERIRELRDSVYAHAPRNGRDEMVWTKTDGRERLLLFPGWWPAGVMITFAPGATGDTLVGEAEALVADLGKPASKTRARVLRNLCARP